MRLTTLLGLDRAPGELASAGLGTQAIPSALARELAEQYRSGSWRVVLTDARGHLVKATVLRARPSGSARPAPRTTGLPGRSPPSAVVEVQAPLAVLDGLDPAAFPGWEKVLGAVHDLAARPAIPGDRSKARRRRRHPDADLEQRIRARDRTCVFPGCRAPALLAEVDHTREWARLGDTVEVNLGMLCKPDHCLKHGGRWRLRQVEPGRFVWTGPSGRPYERRMEPVLRDLPGPLDPGRVRRPYEGVGEDDEFEPILPPPPPEPVPPPERGPGLLELIRRAGVGFRAGTPVDGRGIPY